MTTDWQPKRLPETKKSDFKQDQIIKVVDEMLQSSDVVLTVAILARLEELHIEMGGKNPMSNVAAILSKSPKFVNSRIKRGWMRSAQ